MDYNKNIKDKYSDHNQSERIDSGNQPCQHRFQYPFASCRICGKLLEEGDYTVAKITGNWTVVDD